MLATAHRLRKHAEYQQVYGASRKQFTKHVAYFYVLRPASAAPQGAVPTARIGLTAPKALGNAVIRNRIKRRMREAARQALPLLTAPVDLVLHPRRTVLEMEFAQLQREVTGLFRSVQAACSRVRQPAAEDRHP